MAKTKRLPLAQVSSNTSIAAPASQDGKKTTSKKRKADNEPQVEIPISDPRCWPDVRDIDCDKVRAEIKVFLSQGEMKLGDFLKTKLEIGPSAYRGFMALDGHSAGSRSKVCKNGYAFFKHRELNGFTEPPSIAPKTTPPTKKAKKVEEDDITYDVSGITLDGESDNEVEVYDTCDDIREKIRAHLAKPSVTQAGFLRQIAKTYGEDKSISAAAFNAFMKKKGPSAGNTTQVFYASYVYFEKLRVLNGEEKSDKRLDMEDIWDGLDPFGSGKAGFETKKILSRVRYIVAVGEDIEPYENEYGKVEMW